MLCCAVLLISIDTNGGWIDFASVLELQFYQRKPDAVPAPPVDDDDFSSAEWLVRITLNDELVQCAPLEALLTRLQEYSLPVYKPERDAACKQVPEGVKIQDIPHQSWETGC